MRFFSLHAPRCARTNSPAATGGADAGPNTNGSQFFICVADTDWLNGKHVVFDKLVSGAETLKKMETYGTQAGKTKADVKIHASGQL